MSAVLGLVVMLSASSAHAQSEPVTAGYRDFYFTKAVNGTPTGEKPQSKLWWNDGVWWGSLWDPALHMHTIHLFDLASQSWESTGTAIDDRSDAKADVLWDGEHLYVVSQIFTHNPGPDTVSNGGRLYRFSYHAGTKVHTLDDGFPVAVNASRSETLVLAKDSTGKLWVTWTEGGKVKINRTIGDDQDWGTPFDLSLQGSDLKNDDISTILAFDGDKVGVMWSNQNDRITYFAIHRDGHDDMLWEAREHALADQMLGEISYDHINLKPACDNDGNVYAVTKTSLAKSEQPLVLLIKRNTNGVWTRHLFGTVSEGHTRPILLIDSENRKIYVFAMSQAGGAGAIYMKSSELENISFAPGLGTPFIQSETDSLISNPTSTKQCLNGSTGLLVLASDQGSRHYLHNYLDLGGSSKQYELKIRTVGPGKVVLDPPGGLYDARTAVNLTAVPESGFEFNGWSGDLTGLASPATIELYRDLTVTAEFVSHEGRGQVVHRETQSGSSSGATAVTTLTNLNADIYQVYLAAIASKPQVNVVAVSGLGLAWIPVRVQCSGREQTGIEVWLGRGTPASDGPVTALLAASPQNAVIAVTGYSGADIANPIGSIVAGNSNGPDGACSNGLDSDSYSFDLTTTLNGAMIYSAATMRNTTHAGAPEFTERVQLTHGTRGGAVSLAVGDRRLNTSATVAINGAFSDSVDWAVVNMEIRPEITTAVEEQAHHVTGYHLEQNYPNPFFAAGASKPTGTSFAFSLPKAGNVTVNILAETGQLVRVLSSGRLASGDHWLHWNGRNASGQAVAAGVYFFRLVASDEAGNTIFTQSRRMTLLR